MKSFLSRTATSSINKKKTKTTYGKRPLWRQPIALFVLFFGLVGVSLLVLTRAETTLGTVPKLDSEIVVLYTKGGMPHVYREDGFNSSMPPGMMLYANGLMLCGEFVDHGSGHDSTAPATLKRRQLSAAQTEAVFNKVKSLGIQKASDIERPDDFNEPSALADVITLNSTTGAVAASKYRTEKNTSFDAVRAYLDAECAQTTEPYVPEKVTVQTASVPASKVTLGTIVSDLTTPLLTRLGDELTKTLATVKDVVSNIELDGDQAKIINDLIPRGTTGTYKLQGKNVKLRVLPTVPEYETPTYLTKSGTVSAAATSKVRWLYVIPADGTAKGDEQAYAERVAHTIKDYYTQQTGKSITISQVAVVKGKKTAAQYQVCPREGGCDVCLPTPDDQNCADKSRMRFEPSLAAHSNLSSEFAQDATSTNIIYGFGVANHSCIGWGGPVFSKKSVRINTEGESSFSAVDCALRDGAITRLGAHETGHTFGLPHTPCNGTIMDSGCGAWNGMPPLDQAQAKVLAADSPFFNGGGQPPVADKCPNVPNPRAHVLFRTIPSAGSAPPTQYVQTTPGQNGNTRRYYYVFNYSGAPSPVAQYTGHEGAVHNITYIEAPGTKANYVHKDASSTLHGIELDYTPYLTSNPNKAWRPVVKYQWKYGWTGKLHVQEYNKSGQTVGGLKVSNGDGPGGAVTDQLTTVKYKWSDAAATADSPSLGPCGGSNYPTPVYATPPYNTPYNTPYATPTNYPTPYTTPYQTPPPVPAGSFKVSFADLSTGKTATTTASAINNTWSGSPYSGIGKDYFMVAWEGAGFVAPGSGTYTFYSEQDDGFILKVNGQNIIDRWNNPAATGQASISFSNKQAISISAAMYDTTGTAKAVLYWSGPGINGKQIFPNLGSSTGGGGSTPKSCNFLQKLLGLCK